MMPGYYLKSSPAPLAHNAHQVVQSPYPCDVVKRCTEPPESPVGMETLWAKSSTTLTNLPHWSPLRMPSHTLSGNFWKSIVSPIRTLLVPDSPLPPLVTKQLQSPGFKSTSKSLSKNFYNMMNLNKPVVSPVNARVVRNPRPEPLKIVSDVVPELPAPVGAPVRRKPVGFEVVKVRPQPTKPSPPQLHTASIRPCPEKRGKPMTNAVRLNTCKQQPAPSTKPQSAKQPAGAQYNKEDHQSKSNRFDGCTASSQSIRPPKNRKKDKCPQRTENGRGKQAVNRANYKNSKAKRYAHLTLSEIAQKCSIKDMAVHPLDSTVLQRRILFADPAERSSIFPQIYKHCIELCHNICGNYVIRKYIEHCTEKEKTRLIRKMASHANTLSTGAFAWRVVMTVLKVANKSNVDLFVKEMIVSVLKMSMHHVGNHTIQLAVENASTDLVDKMARQLRGRFVELSMHQYGCRIVQKILERTTPKTTQAIIREIIGSKRSTQLYDICRHILGNYTVQHIMKVGQREQKIELYRALAPNLEHLTTDKFSSNVVEKLWSSNITEIQNDMMAVLLGNYSIAVNVTKSRFGNYVIQHMLTMSTEEQRAVMFEKLNALKDLDQNEFGCFIIAKMDYLRNA